MIFFEETFLDNDDSNWVNITTAGGPISVSNERKSIQGSGITAGALGFVGPVLGNGVSLANKILQADFFLEEDTISAVGLITVAHTGDLGNVSAQPGVHFNYNSFPTPGFVLFDSGSLPADGSFTLPELTQNKRYTVKFYFRADGKITAYITALPEVANLFMGTTTIANDFLTGQIYFAVQQTFINASDKKSFIDNIFVHDEGLDFVVPENRPRSVL